LPFLYLLAVALGISVCLKGTANGLLAGRIGLPLALSINSGVVFVGSMLWFFVARMNGAASPEQLSAPSTYYSGGICGLLIISCAAVAHPRLGAGTTTALAVASQVVTALILDRFGATGVRGAAPSFRKEPGQAAANAN
jgi:transporter family-2 protein